MPAFPHIRRPRFGRPDALSLAVAAVALLGAALVLYRQSAYGVALAADSVHYIAMARNALDGHGFMSVYGNYPPEWPPLAPALYAAFGFGVFDPLAVAGPLNAAAMALTVFTVGAWLRRRVESRFVVVWACLAVVFEIAVVRMFDYAWTEPHFIPLCALALYWADRHLEDGRRSSLAWAAALSALACLSRYAGPAAVVVIAGMLLLRRGVSLRERLAAAAAYSAVSLAPMCAWLARNWLNTGVMTGGRPIVETAREHVAPMLEEMAAWWLPYVPIPGAESAASLWVAAAAATLTAALGMFGLVRWLRTGADAFVPLAVGFSIAHAALTLAALRTGVIGMDRYVIPTYIPLLAAAAFALDRALAWARGVRIAGGRALPAAALIAVLAAWTAYGGFVAASDAVETANGDGVGRMSRGFYESEITTHLRERRGADAGLTFSNQPLQAYLASDGRGLFPVPPYDWREMAATLESRRDADDDTILAWFDGGLPIDYGAAAFRFSPGFQPLGSFQDGEVFRLNPGYPPADPRAGALIEDSYYDVYLNDGYLTWVRQPCSDEDALGVVELSAEPADPADADEFADFGNFEFRQFGAKVGDLCVIRRALPDYPVKTIRTGQFIRGGEWFYRTRIRMPLSEEALAYYRAKYESAAAGELLASSDFDLHLDGGELFYLKEPCAENDTRGRFGLTVFPTDSAHFPEGEGRGHQSMNFDFDNHGVIFEGKCMARRTLPDYSIRAISTGQWIPNERDVWAEAVQMPLGDLALAAYRERYAALSAREPLAGAGLFDLHWDLHPDGGDLVYLKPHCSEDDARGDFRLRVYPVESDALPQDRRGDGFEMMRFNFVQYGVRFDGKCLLARPLPDYEIRSIEASQNIPNEGDLWKATVSPPLSDASLAYYRDKYVALASGEPLARSDFDVYRDGGDLVYLKTPCAESDVAGRFSLTAFPAYADDLPESRRETGHDSFGFDFSGYGVRFGDRCMMRYPLPEYPVRSIETGQWIQDVGFLWKTAAAVPLNGDALAQYRYRHDALASSREPLARSDFDVYRDGGDLVYLKRPCDKSDALGRFLLSVFPADTEDLPPERREAGHAGLNFDFFRYGAVYGDGCMIRRALPGYPIRAIETGQWIPGERGVWNAKIEIGE